MPPGRFEHTISARERPQTYALDRAATGTGIVMYEVYDIFINFNSVVTRWQYTFYTQTIHRTTQITNKQHKYNLMGKTAGRAPSLRVLPWHLHNCEYGGDVSGK